MKKFIIAVDFDGTLVENKFPEIGEPKPEIVKAIKGLSDKGHDIILWTCREGNALDEAVKFCNDNGIKLASVNGNVDRIKKLFKVNSRKIFANIYFDDRASFDLDYIKQELDLEELG